MKYTASFLPCEADTSAADLYKSHDAAEPFPNQEFTHCITESEYEYVWDMKNSTMPLSTTLPLQSFARGRSCHSYDEDKMAAIHSLNRHATSRRAIIRPQTPLHDGQDGSVGDEPDVLEMTASDNAYSGMTASDNTYGGFVSIGPMSRASYSASESASLHGTTSDKRMCRRYTSRRSCCAGRNTDAHS